MKKYLFFALALLSMASCAKDDLGNGNKPNHNGEVEESYIAINLMAADSDTRATDGGYEYGTEAEREVKTAYFFFFDENGEPFNVVNAPATAPGGAKNHLALDITPMTDGTTTNVSDISKAVLILNTYEGIYPKQIVAVLNWVPQNDTYSLKELHNNLTALVGVDAAAGGFVMSNSVYKDTSGNLVDAVALTEGNIKKTASEATNSPIDIYVERIAAKVVLTAGGKAESNTHPNVFNTQKTPDMFVGSGELTTTPVFVQLLGWELYNDYNNSYLLKNIDKTWTEEIGFNWNDSNFFRSYWAISQDVDINDTFTWSYTTPATNGFATEYGFAVATKDTQGNIVDDTSTYTYCGENTNQVVLDGEGKVTLDLRTKVILKGQLLQSDGNGGHKELELASWYGNEYAGTQNLLTAVANSLAYTLYHSDDQTNFHPFTAADIVCDINIAGTKSYETGFKLSVAGEGKTWYKYSSDGNHQPFNLSDSADNIAKTNAYLAANVKPAIIYVDGMTYYYVDVEHLGAKDSDTQYGVVRNHVYQIDINSIKGYGSPIYSGEDFKVEQPEYPAEVEDTYVAARINVLSWKVVKQSVDIGQ